MRHEILSTIKSIIPSDAIEASHRDFALQWVRSGVELCRLKKPATPSPHLVSYFVVYDPAASKILLVDHRNARLWLPTGGHVEPGEHPRSTVEREAIEELGLVAAFLFDDPLFITVTETVGVTAGHVDVSLWYVLSADSRGSLAYDETEFKAAEWFSPSEIPYQSADPHLRGFVRKLKGSDAA